MLQVGTVVSFYYALLTNRAFQISTFAPLPGFDLAFDPNASPIMWLRPPDAEDIIKPMKFSTHRHPTDPSIRVIANPTEVVVDERHNRTKWAYLCNHPPPPPTHTCARAFVCVRGPHCLWCFPSTHCQSSYTSFSTMHHVLIIGSLASQVPN